jgi:hypothetical protein
MPVGFPVRGFQFALAKAQTQDNPRCQVFQTVVRRSDTVATVLIPFNSCECWQRLFETHSKTQTSWSARYLTSSLCGGGCRFQVVGRASFVIGPKRHTEVFTWTVSRVYPASVPPKRLYCRQTRSSFDDFCLGSNWIDALRDAKSCCPTYNSVPAHYFVSVSAALENC